MNFHEFRHEMKNPHFKKAMERISELEEENKRLREALRRTQIAIDAYHSISGVVDMGLADAARHAEAVLTRAVLTQVKGADNA